MYIVRTIAFDMRPCTVYMRVCTRIYHVVRIPDADDHGRERVSALAVSRVSSDLKLSSGELTLSRMLELEILVLVV